MRRRSLFLGLATYLMLAFMLGPLVVLIGASFTKTRYMAFPPEGLTLSWFANLPQNTELMAGLRVSLVLGSAATLVSVALGLGIVLHLRNKSGPIYRALDVYFLSPKLVPTLAMGIGLLFFLSRVDLVGSMIGLLGAHVAMTLPFAIRSIASAVGAIDKNLERAAAISGAAPPMVLWKVTLPAIKPGIVSASMFAFLVSFNNVTIGLFIADIQLTPLPVVLLARSESFLTPEVPAIATCMLVGIVLLMATLNSRFGILNSAKNTARR